MSKGTVKHGRSIGAHLVAFVAIQLVLVLGLIGFAAIQDFRDARSSAEQLSSSSADLAAGFVGDAVVEMRTETASMQQYSALLVSPAVCSLTDSTQQEAWSDTFRTGFLMVHRDGSPMCPNAKGMETYPNVAQTDWFKRALTSPTPVEAGPIPHPVTGKPILIFGVAFQDADAVIATIADLNTMSEAIAEKFESSSLPMSYTITSKSRAVMLDATGLEGMRDLRGTAFDDTSNDDTSNDDTSNDDTFADLEGTERIFGQATVPGLGWQVFAGVTPSDAFAGARRSLNERMLFAAIMVLIVVLAAMYLQRRFLRPIRSLHRGTRKVSEGDLDTKVTASGPSELQELAESFNQMLAIRKDAEAALRKAYKAERKAADELREVDGMRNAFLMAISHELRTPLTSVVGYSTFLSENQVDMKPDEIKTCIESIASQSRRLERLLVDLLDVERLSRGIIEPNLKETDITDLVMRVVDHSPAPGRIKADVKVGITAEVDPALVERMLENLVFNSIKHTPEDSKIWVKVRRVNGSLKLTVEDSGRGVPDELKTAIFEPFKQGDVPSHSPGTGVGLNLVSQFAKLHGGKAWVDDRRGGGASFKIELPAHHKRVATTNRRKRAAA